MFEDEVLLVNNQNNEYINILNDHLPMLRAQSGIKQAELADLIGIARTTYSAIENKKRKMTFPVFINLSKYFLANEKTIKIMELLGLSEINLSPYFDVEELMYTRIQDFSQKKVIAFGGTVSKKSDKQKKIEKALKEIEQK